MSFFEKTWYERLEAEFPRPGTFGSEIPFGKKLHFLQRCSRRALKGDEIFYEHIDRIHGAKQPTGVKITSRLPRIASVD